MTLKEYMRDYASKEVKELGEKIITQNLDILRQNLPKVAQQVQKAMEEIERGKQDAHI